MSPSLSAPRRKTISATGPLSEIDALVHPEGRLHPREITSDLPGRAFDSGGEGRHAMESEFDPKRQEQVRFADEIATYLESARVGLQRAQLELQQRAGGTSRK